ncbi:MAG: TIR domain-containing protein [Candidatus Paceibacterota bacterium]|jgi:hypothetical protein
MKKRIFISFDYDNDKHYRYLLSAFSKNSRFDIEFIDVTPDEIQSYSIDRIKAVLTGKIKDATHTLVVTGEYANSYHRDSREIGARNWQWWEINKSHEEGKGLIGIKIKSTNDWPTPLLGKGAALAHSFEVDAIINAIDKA